MKTVLKNTKRFLAVFLALALVVLTVPETALTLKADPVLRYSAVVDGEGNPVLDGEGNPTYEEDAEGAYVRNEDGSYSLYEEVQIDSQALGDATYDITVSIVDGSGNDQPAATVSWKDGEGNATTQITGLAANTVRKVTVAANPGWTISSKEWHLDATPAVTTTISSDDQAIDVTGNTTVKVTAAKNTYAVTSSGVGAHLAYAAYDGMTPTFGEDFYFSITSSDEENYAVNTVQYAVAGGSDGEAVSATTAVKEAEGTYAGYYKIPGGSVHGAVTITATESAIENLTGKVIYKLGSDTALNGDVNTGISRLEWSKDATNWTEVNIAPLTEGQDIGTVGRTGDTLYLKITPKENMKVTSVATGYAKDESLSTTTSEVWKKTISANETATIRMDNITYGVSFAAENGDTVTVVKSTTDDAAVVTTATKGSNYEFYVKRPNANATDHVTIYQGYQDAEHPGTEVAAAKIEREPVTTGGKEQYVKYTVDKSAVTDTLKVFYYSSYTITYAAAESSHASFGEEATATAIAGLDFEFTMTADTGYKLEAPTAAKTTGGDSVTVAAGTGSTVIAGNYKIATAYLVADTTITAPALTAYKKIAVTVSEPSTTVALKTPANDVYNGTASAYAGGNGNVYTEEATVIFTITAASGHQIDSVKYNDGSAIEPAGDDFSVTVGTGGALAVNSSVKSIEGDGFDFYVNNGTKNITYAVANDGAYGATKKDVTHVTTKGANHFYALKSASSTGIALTLTANEGYVPTINGNAIDSGAVTALVNGSIETKASGTKTVYTMNLYAASVQALDKHYLTIGENAVSNQITYDLTYPKQVTANNGTLFFEVSSNGVQLTPTTAETVTADASIYHQSYEVNKGEKITITATPKAGYELTGATVAGKKATVKAGSFTMTISTSGSTIAAGSTQTVALTTVPVGALSFTGTESLDAKGVYTVITGKQLTPTLAVGDATPAALTNISVSPTNAGSWTLSDNKITVPADAAGKTVKVTLTGTAGGKSGSATATFAVKAALTSASVKGVNATKGASQEIGTTATYTIVPGKNMSINNAADVVLSKTNANVTLGAVTPDGKGNATFTVTLSAANDAGNTAFTDTITIKNAGGDAIGTMALNATPSKITTTAKGPTVSLVSASDNQLTLKLALPSGITTKYIEGTNAGEMFYEIIGTEKGGAQKAAEYVKVSGASQTYVWTDSQITHNAAANTAKVDHVMKVRLLQPIAFGQAATADGIGNAANRIAAGTQTATDGSKFQTKANAWTTKLTVNQKARTMSANADNADPLTVTLATVSADKNSSYTNDADFSAEDITTDAAAGQITLAINNGVLTGTTKGGTLLGVHKIKITANAGAYTTPYTGAEISKIISVTVQQCADQAELNDTLGTAAAIQIAKKSGKAANYTISPAFPAGLANSMKTMTWKVYNGNFTTAGIAANAIAGNDLTLAANKNNGGLYGKVSVTTAGKITVAANYVISSTAASNQFTAVGTLKANPGVQIAVQCQVVDAAQQGELGEIAIRKLSGGTVTLFRNGDTITPADLDSGYGATSIDVVVLKKGAPAIGTMTAAQWYNTGAAGEYQVDYFIDPDSPWADISFKNSTAAVADMTDGTFNTDVAHASQKLTFKKNGNLMISATSAALSQTVKATFKVVSNVLADEDTDAMKYGYTLSANGVSDVAAGTTPPDYAITYSSAEQGTVLVQLQEYDYTVATTTYSAPRVITNYDANIAVTANNKNTAVSKGGYATAKVTATDAAHGLYTVAITPNKTSGANMYAFQLDVTNKNLKSKDNGYVTTYTIRNGAYADVDTAGAVIRGDATDGTVFANFADGQSLQVTLQGAATAYPAANSIKVSFPASYTGTRYAALTAMAESANDVTYGTLQTSTAGVADDGIAKDEAGNAIGTFTKGASDDTAAMYLSGKLATGTYEAFLTLGTATYTSNVETAFAPLKTYKATFKVAAAKAFKPVTAYALDAYNVSGTIDDETKYNNDVKTPGTMTTQSVVPFDGTNIGSNVRAEEALSIVDKDGQENNFGAYFKVYDNWRIGLTYAGWQKAIGSGIGSADQVGYISYKENGETLKLAKVTVAVTSRALLTLTVEDIGGAWSQVTKAAISYAEKTPTNLTANGTVTGIPSNETVYMTLSVDPAYTPAIALTKTADGTAVTAPDLTATEYDQGTSRWLYTYEFPMSDALTATISATAGKEYELNLKALTGHSANAAAGKVKYQVGTGALKEIDDASKDTKMNVANGTQVQVQIFPKNNTVKENHDAYTVTSSINGSMNDKALTPVSWSNTKDAWVFTMTGMPAKDQDITFTISPNLTVTPTWDAGITGITYTTSVNGSSTGASKDVAIMVADGHTVTFTPTAAENYRVETVSAVEIKADESETALAVTDNGNGTWSVTVGLNPVKISFVTRKTANVTPTYGEGFTANSFSYLIQEADATAPTSKEALTKTKASAGAIQVGAGEALYFTLSVADNYRIKGVTQTPDGGAAAAVNPDANGIYKVVVGTGDDCKAIDILATSQATITLTPTITNATVTMAAVGEAISVSTNAEGVKSAITGEDAITLTSGEVVTVDSGSFLYFVITPDDGYQLTDTTNAPQAITLVDDKKVTVDAQAVVYPYYWTSSAVSAAQTLTVTAKKKLSVAPQVTITGTAHVYYNVGAEAADKGAIGTTSEATTGSSIAALDGQVISFYIADTEETDSIETVTINGEKRPVSGAPAVDTVYSYTFDASTLGDTTSVPLVVSIVPRYTIKVTDSSSNSGVLKYCIGAPVGVVAAAGVNTALTNGTATAKVVKAGEKVYFRFPLNENASIVVKQGATVLTPVAYNTIVADGVVSTDTSSVYEVTAGSGNVEVTISDPE